jgi:primary-amine oxidase
VVALSSWIFQPILISPQRIIISVWHSKMSTESIATSFAPQLSKSTPMHPLAPLSESELKAAASIIKASWPAHTDLHFKVVTLEEPPKAEVLPYLDAEHSGKPLPSISRKAFVNYYIRNTV